ncbi:MAG: hypothetical protein FH753_16085 [Firmicutes bacterium]|nr:hypothetical protein [Bacillota bacterium]
MVKKKITFIANSILFIWFFLDMIGMTINKRVLVLQSWKYDGIFFIIYITSFLFFIFKERTGKYILSVWLFMWLITQFYFHWCFTIFGPWEGRIKYFDDTIKLISSTTVYIPDLYHILLHIFILFALISTLIYCTMKKTSKDKIIS